MKIGTLDVKFNFAESFDTETGRYVRSDVMGPNGENLGNPFQRSFPFLCDLGIMGHCFNGLSGLCTQAGIQCYQSGQQVQQPHMTLEDYKSIIKQSRGKVFEIALGGRGDPNKHPDFKAILEYTRDSDIVPNYTTSGLSLTDTEIALTKKFCGAVACSWHRSQYTVNAIDGFIRAKVKTNIHYILGKNTIDEAIDRLTNDTFPAGINAIIFLLHKPAGQGTSDNVLSAQDPRLLAFFSLIDNWNKPYKIGFDACSTPGLVNFTKNISPETLEPCEGARFSCYISPNMTMVPCSFDTTHVYGVDLHKFTMQEAWDSPTFELFRSKLRNTCPVCTSRANCMGGCPLMPQVTLCNRKGDINESY